MKTKVYDIKIQEEVGFGSIISNNTQLVFFFEKYVFCFISGA